MGDEFKKKNLTLNLDRIEIFEFVIN